MDAETSKSGTCTSGTVKPAGNLITASDQSSKEPTPSFNCVVCSKVAETVPFRLCEGSKHIICSTCFVEKDQEIARFGVCPVVTKNGKICGSQLVGSGLGIPAYLDFMMKQWRYPCPDAKFGCTFTGTGYEIVKHEDSNCPFRYLRICDLKECKVKCNDVFGLLQHKMQDHGQHFPEFSHTVGFEVATKPNDKLGNAWVQHSLHAIPYGGSDLHDLHYGLLVVEENHLSYRMWITELNPNSTESFKYKLMLPDNLDEGSNQRKGWCVFVDYLLPYLTVNLSHEEEDDIRYFEISKNMALKYAYKTADGNPRLQIYCMFWAEAPLTFDNVEIEVAPESVIETKLTTADVPPKPTSPPKVATPILDKKKEGSPSVPVIASPALAEKSPATSPKSAQSAAPSTTTPAAKSPTTPATISTTVPAPALSPTIPTTALSVIKLIPDDESEISARQKNYFRKFSWD